MVIELDQDVIDNKRQPFVFFQISLKTCQSYGKIKLVGRSVAHSFHTNDFFSAGTNSYQDRFAIFVGFQAEPLE